MRIVVPFTPGGGTDILSRIIAQKLNESWGQPVVVENRPGASGTVGTAFVAKAPGRRADAAGRARRLRRQSEPLQEAAVRPEPRAGAGVAARLRPARAGGPSLAAGEIGQGTRRVRARAARRDQLRLARRRHPAPPVAPSCSIR